jgi:hypothetical protein
MTATYIIIDINSDIDPISYPTDTDEEISVARVALRDAGLAYEDVWAGDIGCPDSYKSGSKLFAAPRE